MLKNKRITVTGGKGSLGKHLIKKLAEHGCANIEIADLPEYNLAEIAAVRRMYAEKKPDIELPRLLVRSPDSAGVFTNAS